LALDERLMNRQRRARERFQAGIRAVQSEGQGLWNLWVIRPDDHLELLLRAVGGDAHARQLVDLTCQTLRQVVDNRARDPALCLLCEHRFTIENPAPAAIVILAADFEVAGHAIANVICERCYSAEDLGQRIVAFYRRTVIPDARVVRVVQVAEPGHA
jgi:hypothetical protein